MINSGVIIRKAYYDAITAIDSNYKVYDYVSYSDTFPYIVIDEINEEGGSEAIARTKGNKNASDVVITIKIYSRFTSGKGGRLEVDNIATAIMPTLLPTDPTNYLDFSPLENVVTHLVSSSYTKEFKEDKRLIITKEINIYHAVSQL